MGDFAAFVAVIVLILFGVASGYLIRDHTMSEDAFDRGYMVECLGKYGYYWECE